MLLDGLPRAESGPSPEIAAMIAKALGAPRDDVLIKGTPASQFGARTSGFSGLSAETLAALSKLGLGQVAEELEKTISIGTGLLAYDLQAPAKNLYPFLTPIRNVMPRVGGGTGSATNWRQVNAIIGSGFDSMGWIPEGQRSGPMSYSTSNKSASFVTIGEEDAATYEAISAGRGFEDIQAMMTFRLLQKMMLKEEMAILFGNAGSSAGGLSLGTPATPAVSSTGTGATLPNGTYYVKVVALTGEGFQNTGPGGVGNPLGAGAASPVTPATIIPTTKTVIGQDQRSYTLAGGSSNISAESSGQSVTLGAPLLATVTAILGAVAYAWFVGTASGAETLQAITTINSLSLGIPLVAGTQPASTITADNSGNAAYAYNGLLTTALASGTAYVNSLATGTAGVGTVLTSSGRGSVKEIDAMLLSMWNNYQLSPTVIYVNAQELNNITSKVLNGTSSPLLRVNETDGEYHLTASGTIDYYYNPFAIGTGLKIPVRIHPRVPPGTIIGWAENLPIQYQSNEVPNVAEVKTRQDYYQIDWPITTRQRQVGVYAETVLAVYAPFAMGVITNIGNG